MGYEKFNLACMKLIIQVQMLSEHGRNDNDQGRHNFQPHVRRKTFHLQSRLAQLAETTILSMLFNGKEKN